MWQRVRYAPTPHPQPRETRFLIIPGREMPRALTSARETMLILKPTVSGARLETYACREPYQALALRTPLTCVPGAPFAGSAAPVAQLKAPCLSVQLPGSSRPGRQWGKEIPVGGYCVSAAHGTVRNIQELLQTQSGSEWGEHALALILMD